MDTIKEAGTALPGPHLRVERVEGIDSGTDLETVSAVLDRQQKEALAQCSWPAFGYRPVVFFSLAHAGDCLLVKFYVEENTLVAACASTHDAVYQDSCVELFIAFGEESYYNFEFNATGVCLAAYGKEREGRRYLPVSAIERIRRRGVVDRGVEGCGVCWSLTLVLPLEVFVFQRPQELGGQQCRANFYKCGDQLPQPHYLSWAAIATPEPDFHQPAFFGSLLFK